jgi:hypothetical protein
MWNPPTKIQLSKIPPLYAQEKVKDKRIFMKFFLGGWSWYVAEYDGNDIFFGFVVSPLEPEGSWGYFSLSELSSLSSSFMQVDRDLYSVTPYSPKRLSEIMRLGG